MLEPVVALLRQAGTAGVLLAIVSTIMWMTVVLRAVALFPRCYRGHHDRARFVASVYGPPASVHHHPPPGHPLLRRFVARLASLPSDVDLADHATRTWERHTREELSRGRHWLVALIVAAPLLGLLGTVNGMIELFASLQTRDVTAAGGQASMAGGISTALITTQLGLVTGALGLLAARVLERRERWLGGELSALRALVRDAPSEGLSEGPSEGPSEGLSEDLRAGRKKAAP